MKVPCKIFFLWASGQRFPLATVTITPGCFNLTYICIFQPTEHTIYVLFLISELSDFEESVYNLIPSFLLNGFFYPCSRIKIAL